MYNLYKKKVLQSYPYKYKSYLPCIYLSIAWFQWNVRTSSET